MADGFAAEMAALARSIREREARNRAADKAFAEKRSPCARRAHERQQKFLAWCSMELQTAVSQAAVALQPAGYTIKQTVQRHPPNCRYLDESRNWLLAQTEIVLAREGVTRTLTITLTVDGRAHVGVGREACQGCAIEKLGTGHAAELVRRFVRSTIEGTRLSETQSAS